MRVAVTGGRHYHDRTRVWDVLDQVHGLLRVQHGFTITSKPITTLIHGGAKGADHLAGIWADHRGVHVAVYAADWDLHGRRAGIIRNVEMLSAHPRPELLIAFPGGRGTAHATATARMLGIPVLNAH